MKESVIISIANIGSFDSNSLTYIDFLDCLIRVAHSYPFSEEDKNNYPTMEAKLHFLIKKLEDKFGGLVDQFVESLKKKNKEMNYQPKVIIDDDGEGDEYDDNWD